MKTQETLRKEIIEAVGKLYKLQQKNRKFSPGETSVPVSGKVFDDKELTLGVESILDGWWTEGRFTEEFEKKFAKFLQVRYVSLVNSGSSANLVAFSALTSNTLGDKALHPGDEVITVATGFPTTVNPIILKGCTPVFVDIDLGKRNAVVSQVKKAISKKTKAIVMAHTLGNPFNIRAILELVKKNKLWLIEDCCDALGSLYEDKLVGTFGDIATFSFYPAHQITMGEGGAVITNNPFLHRAIRQFRDWGRDCWCDTGKDNTCGRRFGWKLGELPLGYDHKYTYSQIGYNVKLTDMQAAIGVAQLDKLPFFIKKRKENFSKLYSFFKKYTKYFVLPEWEKDADPCWFGFMIVVKDTAPFARLAMVNFLESKKIATRSLFAGNLLRHPAYLTLSHRKVSKLQNSDRVMNNGFWIGVFPGLEDSHINYITSIIDEFISLNTRSKRNVKKK